MIRTYMQQNWDWFANCDPFSLVGDMESEIAELRTLTKVTRLRKQIECREEGAWVVVKDIPDDKAPSGTRKVTSYGMSKRSVTSTRSVSSNVDFKNVFDDEVPMEPLVQLPGEESDSHSNPCTVEITEVFEEPLRREVPESNRYVMPEKTTNKKTSVVTLGKGNLVLIDPEEDETNFHVTGISKGKVADVVSTLERSSEKKIKKVGFCKTEVHFAPDSGKINIVETDEKPPPTQVYRKKKRTRGVKSSRASSCLPKHYFGEMDDFGEDSNLSESDKEDNKSALPERGVLADVREKLPIFEKTIKSEGKDLKYRHSSPDKNGFDIEKIESEGKEFFKKVKQPSFRDKFLKETSFLPEKMFSDRQSNLDDLVQNLDKHPCLKDNLYIYGSCAHSQDRELLKSNCKLSSNDFIPESNKKTSTNTSPILYHSEQELDDKRPLQGNDLSHNLRYVELLKFSPLFGEKENETQQVNIEKNVIEVKNMPIVKTSCVSESDSAKLKKSSISDMRLDITRSSRVPVDQDNQPGMSFLGHVSPKLQNLIQNSVEHEFQLRQKQILQKKSLEEKMQTSHLAEDRIKTSVASNLSIKNQEIRIGDAESKLKPVKIVTQVRLGPESESKHEFQVKREEITKNLFGVPVNENKDIKFKENPYLLKEEPVPAPRGKKEPQIKKDINKVPPKPKPRTITTVPLDKSLGRTAKTPTNRSASRTESSLSSKRVKSKESISRRESDKNITRSTISKEDSKIKKLPAHNIKTDTIMNKATRVIKVTAEAKGGKKAGREPLRSFEKVSNGWVGHIVPLKPDGITVTTKVYSSTRSGTQGLHTSGSKKTGQTSSTVRTSQSHSSKVDVRRESKQFSLSKEHLSSAKLVKEVTPRRGSSAKKVGSKVERGSAVGSYRPRPRRESERSDDSVVQADEEVRAYMFDGNRNKRK